MDGWVGHNVSRSKQLSIAEDQRIGGLVPYVVPGWRLELGPERIVPERTLLGAFRRNQVLLYRCQRDDCRRRVEPDLEAVVRGGHGHLRPGELELALRCDHPLGCRVKLFSETYPAGVPLVAYLAERDALVVVTCVNCKHFLAHSVAATIDRLKASRRGDASTGIIELAGRIRGPCKRCKGRTFSVTVDRAPRRGP